MKKTQVIITAISIAIGCLNTVAVAQKITTAPNSLVTPPRKPNLFEILFGQEDAKPAQTIEQVIKNDKARTAQKKPAKKNNLFDRIFKLRKAPNKPAPTNKKLPFRPVPVAATKTAPKFVEPTVITGAISCARKTVTITPQSGTYVISVPLNKKAKRTYVMRKVHSDTGAIRLQNTKGNAYWLQLGNKSMLIDTKAGGRLADNCRNDAQQRVEDELKAKTTQLF